MSTESARHGGGQVSAHSWYDRGPKRLFDLLVLVMAHALLLPIWLALWIFIPLALLLLEGRPLLYRQERVGRHGKVFRVWKFRTMIRGADVVGSASTQVNDPRITRSGRWLRRTALDELPQVVNIARGDMGFVGPRALAKIEVDELERQFPDFVSRKRVRPGLTGLAQLHAPRGDARSKLSYDLRYVESMSPLLDAKILVISVWRTLARRWDSG